VRIGQGALLAVLLAALPAPALAQQATASLTVQDGLSIATVRPLRVPVSEEGSTLGLTARQLAGGPAVIEVSGDANRVYRVQIAGDDPGAVPLEIVSSNTGDISAARIGVMDANGRDMLHIAGDPETLRSMFGDAGRIPLSIQYE
jgi:hypothetical protein